MKTNEKKRAAVQAMVAAFGSREEAMVALAAAYGQKALPADVAALAALVTATAKGCPRAFPSGREAPGEAKVFVGEIAKALAEQGYDTATLKAQIVAARRAGALKMSRCDLVPMFPYAMVEASEVTEGNACWHFVRV